LASEYSCIREVVWSLLNVAANAWAAALTLPAAAGVDAALEDEETELEVVDVLELADVDSPSDPHPASSRRVRTDAAAGVVPRMSLDAERVGV
jgi:hypothetical protein